MGEKEESDMSTNFNKPSNHWVYSVTAFSEHKSTPRKGIDKMEYGDAPLARAETRRMEKKRFINPRPVDPQCKSVKLIQEPQQDIVKLMNSFMESIEDTSIGKNMQFHPLEVSQLYEERFGTIESSDMPEISSTYTFLGNENKDRSAIIRSMNDSSIENINFSDQRVCDFVKIPHRSDYNNRSKKSSNEAEPERGRIIKSSAPLGNILKHEEQPNSLQVSIANSTMDYNEHWEHNDNEDEVGIKMKTEDHENNTEDNSPNAVGNSKKLKKSSNKHLKEAKTVNSIQCGKFKLPQKQKKRIKDAIIQSNHDKAEELLDAHEFVDKQVVDRIRASGLEMHDDLNISDYKQYYEITNNHQDTPGEFSWRNVDWIFSPKDILNPTQKLQQISTAILHRGHGSSMHDLRIMHKIARGTPCSPELVNNICDLSLIHI